MRHASICLMLWRALTHPSTSMLARIHRHETLPMHTKQKTLPDFRRENGAPLLPYSYSKNLVRIVFCVLWHTWGKALLDFRHKIRRNAIGFLSWKFSNDSKHTRKHRSRPHPFRNQTSKPNSIKASKANANNSFSIANVRKLRFYHKKRLSTDGHYGVPNTFPHVTRFLNSKNQDFLFIRIRLGKTSFFLA